MQLRPFLLDTWLDAHKDIAFNLGGSTGPIWTIGEVLDLEPGSRDRVFAAKAVYTPSAGAPALRQAIAEMQGVDPDHVVVVAGASEALLHVFFHAAAPRANVVVPFPCFPPYVEIPKALGLEVRTYHLRAEHGYRIDVDEVARAIDRHTRLLLVNSPHNPTGAVIAGEDMRRLHDLAVERGIQFVSDEVFHPIYHGEKQQSAAALPHATVLGDLSKAFSLSGLRLGWIVERDAARRAQYVNARQYFTISNTAIGELVATIAVRHRDIVLGRTQAVATANLKQVDALMAAHANVLSWVRPCGGMTGFPRFASGTDTRPFCDALAKSGVLLVPGDCFDAPEHFRIGFGVGADWFATAMERLATALAPS